MTTKRMKSREIRDNWRETLRHVENGGTVVIEHYNRPIARIVPIGEAIMDTQDMIDQVNTTLGDAADDFDAAAIVEEIGDTYGRDQITSVDDVPSAEYWKIVRKHERKNVVVWSVVEGTSPDARAVEPAPAGVDIPADVLEWAEENGVAVDNPDVYVLVTPADEAGEVDGEIAHRRGEVSDEDMAAIRSALGA